MKYSFYSTAGRIKAVNEDALLLQVAICGSSVRGMVAVCDGVSSLSNSSRTSAFVIRQLHILFERWKKHSIQPQCELLKIHRQLYEKGQRDHRRYGTTCSLFLFEDDAYDIYHIGDSRIYLMQDKLSLLTVDQTLAQMKYDRRIISFAEYTHSDERHVLTQCLGISTPLQMVHFQGKWNESDAVFVCSDGISNALDEAILQEYVRRFLHAKQQGQAKAMAHKAMAKGERDNLSAVLFTRGDGL